MGEINIDIYDIIQKKKNKLNLSKEEYEYIFDGYKKDKISDYQVAGFLMAISINEISDDEIIYIINAISKRMKNFKGIDTEYTAIDSIECIADKSTLLALFISSCFNIKSLYISNSSYEYMGGSTNKLNSIENIDLFKTDGEIVNQLENDNIAVVNEYINEEDFEYKLSKVFNNVSLLSSPQILAIKLISKYLAYNIKKVVCNVKYGEGLIFSSKENALDFADLLKNLSNKLEIEINIVISEINEPMTKNVGNALEIKEMISFLLSEEETINLYENKDLKDNVFEIVKNMLRINNVELENMDNEIMNVLVSKKTYNEFIKFIKNQEGKTEVVYMDWLSMNLEFPILIENVKYLKEIKAKQDGYVISIDSKKIGNACNLLCGNNNEIDYGAGFEFYNKVGSKVEKGDVIFSVMYSDKEKFNEAYEYIKDSIHIDNINQKSANMLRYKQSIVKVM